MSGWSRRGKHPEAASPYKSLPARLARPESVSDEDLRRRDCDVCGGPGDDGRRVGLRDLDTGERFRGWACGPCLGRDKT